MNGYFDVVITNNSFYIVESSSKPKTHDSALETLKKIEWVVKNKLSYDSSKQDIYSNQSQDELFEILKDKSSQIHSLYHTKLSKLNWLLRIIFSQEEEIIAVHSNIDNYIKSEKLGSYFDLVITNQSFYVVESSSKPQTHDSALETLKKIEFVVGNKLSYDSSKQDIYSNQSQDKLFEILKDKSSKIHSQYHKKLFKLNWLEIIFSGEEKIIASHTHIHNYIQPSQLLPLPEDMIQEIAKHLDVPGLGALTELNRQGKTDAATASVKKAQNLGYEGHNHAEAVKYIDDLFKEIANLKDQGILPAHICYDTNTFLPKTLSPEEILKNLQSLSTEDLFTVLSNEKLYSENFKKVKKIFSLEGNWKVTKNDNDIIKQRGGLALVFSAKYGDKDITELLLQHGADPNIPATNGSCPLHFASQRGDADIVELLLINKAKVNERGFDNGTALAFACGFHGKSHHKPNPKVVELLLQHDADPNIPATNGSCPLHFASQKGDADIVELLLISKTKVNEKAGGGNTALAFACGYGDRTYHKANAKVVELLLQHDADPNIPATNGSYPLHLASQEGYADIVELLLINKAKVNEKGGGNTALAFACGFGNTTYHKPNAKVVELLLQHDADPNIPATNGSCPLHFASQAGYAHIVELLLINKARVNERTREGNNTALAFACGYHGGKSIHKPDAKVVELLLQHDADPNISTQNGSFPLHFASQAGYADIVELLLKNQARVNERGVDAATALAFACGHGDRTYHKPNAKVVELLLQHDADPNISTQNGLTPLKLAEKNDYIEIISLLLDHNATL